MMILDTDHLTVIQRQAEPAYSHLQVKLRETPPNEIWTTIISVEEQMRGWLAVIARSRKIQHEIAAYRHLHTLLTVFHHIPVLDFDETAAEWLTRLRRSRLHLGSMDLKIAAIALCRGAILLSRNLSDFRQIPGLQVEDWTQ
ncbi:MAG: type II toxin-antitoxin system VapC family toxin [Candidatus Latescibacteria bacterium]|nr:type II toxin-antitoxin system VapC family toxin [Candidatus Latescibacterota bacterium]